MKKKKEREENSSKGTKMNLMCALLAVMAALSNGPSVPNDYPLEPEKGTNGPEQPGLYK